MNNYPSSSHSRPLFPAYRDEEPHFSPDRFLGSQDRGRAFYEHNMQSSRSPVGQRETSSFMNVHHSTALEEDSAQHYILQNYNEQVSQSRYGRESSQYDRRRDQCADTANQVFRNSLYSERDALEWERASFSNMFHLRSSSRPNLHGNSLSAFPTCRQKDTVLHNSYGIVPSIVDLALKEKFQNHMQNELQQLSQEETSLHRSSSRYQNDFSYSRHGGALEQERLCSDLPSLKNSRQSFDRDFSKDFHVEVEHSKIAAWNNEKESHLVLGNRPVFPSTINSEREPGELDVSKGLYASRNSPCPTDRLNQMKVTLASEQNSNISGKNESFSSKSLELGNLEKEDMLMYSDEPVICTEKQVLETTKDSLAFQSDIQKHISLTNQSVFKTNLQIPEKQIARSLRFSAVHPPGLKNKDDLQAKTNLENFLPENSSLPQVADPPENVNNFLSKNSDSKDGSLKSFDEDSLHKLLEVATKTNSCDNSLSTDDWPSSHSIPFLGETTDTTIGNAIPTESKLNEKFSPQIQEKSQDDSILSSTSLNESGENDKIRSTLEGALETLKIKEPIVGLDYIIEYKDIVSIDGGFAFHCKLCKSSISRRLIIEHLQGFKHRFNYLKLKDEISCKYIVNGLAKQSEKDEYVYKASERLEKTYGRGNVVVKLESSGAKKPLQIRYGKVPDKTLCGSVSNQEEHLSSEPFTINKNDEFTCSTDSVDDSLYGDEHHSSSSLPSDPIYKKELNEEAKENAISKFTSNQEFSELSSHKKPTQPDTQVTKHTNNEQILDQLENDLRANHSNASLTVGALKRPTSPPWHEQPKRLKQDTSGDLDVSHADPMLFSTNKSGIGNSQSNAASSQTQVFNPLVFEQLSKYDISTDEEADIVLKSVAVLTKLLLRYKLRHIASEDVENLMTSVHSRPENVDKLLHLIKDKASATFQTEIEKNIKLRLNSDFSIKGTENLESNNACDSLGVLQSETLKQNSMEVLNYSRATGEVGEQNMKGPKTLNSNENLNLQSSIAPKPLCHNAMEVNSPSHMASTVSHPKNAAWLQPPPFFQWPDSSIVPTSSVSTAVSGSLLQNRGMGWSSAYQTPLSAMPFYQHGYGTGSAMYQGFSVPMTQCIPVTPVDIRLLQPPPPPVSQLPKPPLPQSISSVSKPPLPPSISSVSKPPLPPIDSPLQKPPLPPPGSALPKPSLLPSIGADSKHSVAPSLQPLRFPLLLPRLPRT